MAMGFCESALSVGYVLGPMMAGFAAKALGFAAPFLISGGIALAFCPVPFLLLPQGTDPSNGFNSVFNAGLIPRRVLLRCDDISPSWRMLMCYVLTRGYMLPHDRLRMVTFVMVLPVGCPPC